MIEDGLIPVYLDGGLYYPLGDGWGVAPWHVFLLRQHGGETFVLSPDGNIVHRQSGGLPDLEGRWYFAPGEGVVFTNGGLTQ